MKTPESQAAEYARKLTKDREVFDDNDERIAARAFSDGAAHERARAEGLCAALEGCIKQCDFASEILTLTHPELSNVEMNTLTTRQYMLWSRSAKSDAVELAREKLAKFRSDGGK